jgi:fatty acid desaturase
MKRFPFGYRPSPEIAASLRHLGDTNVVVSVGWAVFYLLSIFLIGFGIDYVSKFGGWQSVVAYVIGVIVIARQLRGLEMMVHDGSHSAWHRKNRKINDVLTDMLASFPIFFDVKGYRDAHLTHHQKFGSAGDIDYARYKRIGFMKTSTSDWLFNIRLMLRVLPRHVLDYFTFSDSKTNVIGLLALQPVLLYGILWHFMAFYGILWHFTFAILPLYLMTGSISFALTTWLLYFAIPFFLIMPMIRAVADAEEHFYQYGSEFYGTINSIGLLHFLIFQPCGSGYHLAHHLFPYVPHWHYRKLHKELVKKDPHYAQHALYRTLPMGPCRSIASPVASMDK